MRNLGVLLLVVASIAAGARAQTTWKQVVIGPAAYRFAIATDLTQATTPRVLRYGGATSTVNNATLLAETWAWNGKSGSWTRLSPKSSPPAGRGFRMAWLQTTTWKGVVMFGGLINQGSQSVLTDRTFLWDGATWSEPQLTTKPKARGGHAMARDEKNHVILFGGWDGLSQHFLDTWQWDGKSWQDLKVSGPSRRRRHAMAYAGNKTILLFGGRELDSKNKENTMADTWLWSGGKWTPLQPKTTPPARELHQMVWDPARQRVVMFGGFPGKNSASLLGDTWEWTGSDWVKRSVTTPPARRHAMAWDPARQRVLLAGGETLDNGNNWVLRNSTWDYGPTNPAQSQAFGTGCGGNKVPVLQIDPPWVGQNLNFGLSNLKGSGKYWIAFGASNTKYGTYGLPLDLAPFGMTGCTMLVSLDVLLSGTFNNNAPSFKVLVPNAPALVGLAVFAQAAAADSTANAAGLAWTQGIKLVIGGV